MAALMMNPQNPRELAELYPYQFADDRAKWMVLTVGRGWFPLFAALCRAIDNIVKDDSLHTGFVWLQLKEKFGGATFHYESHAAGAKKDFIRNLVREAMNATDAICQVCGLPGELNLTDGTYMTLCEMHSAQRANRTLDFDAMWFSLEDNFPGSDYWGQQLEAMDKGRQA